MENNYITAADHYLKVIKNHGTNNVSRTFKLQMPTISTLYAKQGAALRQASHMAMAVDAFRNAVMTAEWGKDKLSSHNSLGNLLQSLGDHAGALEEYKLCIELCEDLKDYVSLGWTHGNMGNACIGLHEKDKALYHLKKSLESCNYRLAQTQAVYGNDRTGEGRALGNLGNLFLLRKNFSKAVECYSEVLQLSKESAVSGFLAFSGVKTSFRGSPADTKDVLLFPSEVENLTITPAVVVLSSCDSARGTSILSTLWKVPDESAGVFMQFFYQYLGEDGLSTTQALQKAVCSLRMLQEILPLYPLGCISAVWKGNAITRCCNGPVKLQQDIDHHLSRGSTVHEIFPLPQNLAMQRLVYELVRAQVPVAQKDQTVLEECVEYAYGSPDLLNLTASVLIKSYENHSKLLGCVEPHRESGMSSSLRFDSEQVVTHLVEQCSLSTRELLVLYCLSGLSTAPIPLCVVRTLISHFGIYETLLLDKLETLKLVSRYPQSVILNKELKEEIKMEPLYYVPRTLSTALWNHTMSDEDKMMSLTVMYKTLYSICY
eukprot:Em0009g296a